MSSISLHAAKQHKLNLKRLYGTAPPISFPCGLFVGAIGKNQDVDTDPSFILQLLLFIVGYKPTYININDFSNMVG